jgi:hypothetical protein
MDLTLSSERTAVRTESSMAKLFASGAAVRAAPTQRRP